MCNKNPNSSPLDRTFCFEFQDIVVFQPLTPNTHDFGSERPHSQHLTGYNTTHPTFSTRHTLLFGLQRIDAE